MPIRKSLILLGLVLLAGCSFTRANRPESYEPSAVDTDIPNGSIYGVVMNNEGHLVRHGRIVLVRDMPPDGIHEREANIEHDGSFTFRNIPAGMYDYVFVFGRDGHVIPQSTLVARAIEVQRNTLNAWKIVDDRIYWQEVTGLPRPKHEIPFMSREDVRSLVRNTKKELPIWPGDDETIPPPLVADVLTGHRANTTLVRNWLLDQRELLNNVLLEPTTTEGVVQHTIDVASVYGFNQSSGILTAREEATVRSVLLTSAQQISMALALGQLPRDTHAHIALALVASVMEDHQNADKWLKAADEEYERRLAVASVQSEYDPASISRVELIALLQYSMIRHGDWCRHRAHELQKVVKRVSHTLTPAERRVLVPKEGEIVAVDPSLAYLGLAKTAFAGTEAGSDMITLWELAGKPFWMPRADESILGIVQAAAKMPLRGTVAPLQSEKITKNTAVLTGEWGTPEEWLVYVRGWDIDVHAGGAPLLRIRTYTDVQDTQVKKLIRLPNVDYILLSGFIEQKPAYRHILFNKRGNYVLISDEVPQQTMLRTKVIPARVAEGGFVEGHGGRKAQVIALGHEAARAENSVDLVNESTRAALLVFSPPEQAQASLSAWDAIGTVIRKDSDDKVSEGNALVVETRDRGREYIWLSRTNALVEDQKDDNIIEGKLGIIRRNQGETELTLLNANWAQSDDFLFKLNEGFGCVTIFAAKCAEGWTAGNRRCGFLDMAALTPDAPLLQLDGKYRAFEKQGRKIYFVFPGGKHSFVIN